MKLKAIDKAKRHSKLLTIIIPTYNRARLLQYTLSLFKEQIIRNQQEVELCVCDNASTDDTDRVMRNYLKEASFFTYRHYEDHIELGGDSIVRSAENAEGEFCLIYGDDDIPMPFMVDVILNNIKKYPNIGYIGFNRLRGNSCDEGEGINNIHVAGMPQVDNEVLVYDDISDYAEEHQHEVGFISTNIVRTALWKQRLSDVYPNNHRGYEFILPYLYSAKGYKAIYIQYPLCVQRVPSHNSNNGVQSWADKMMLYFYLGRPRSIFAQEKYGIVREAKKKFAIYEQQFGRQFLFSHLIAIPAASQEVYHCKEELASYLSDEMEVKMVTRLLSTSYTKRKLFRAYYYLRIYGVRHIIGQLKVVFQ